MIRSGDSQRRIGFKSVFNTGVAIILLPILPACESIPPAPPDPQAALIAKGENIFFNETFNGNGRTCGSCHRAEDNFTISPAFIASLKPDDPLFIAEINPDLAVGFENPVLMRKFALIVENQDGFDDLTNNFNMRGIPHTLGLPNTIASQQGPRTGWSGDGAPLDGSLRAFAVGAVIQHFPLTTNRIAGVDFRLPTDDELDALEAFQLSLGRQDELQLPLPLKGVVANRGQEIFLDNTSGKCNACHFNAGANANPAIFGASDDNRNFNTGVENLPDRPATLTGELIPIDDGFGTPGNGEFNTPSIIEAADTGPFFHDNSIETIEGAVAFYNGDSFTNSPAGQLLVSATGSAINLDATQVVAVAAFLRVINALENIRESIVQLERALNKPKRLPRESAQAALLRAIHETEDAIEVLSAGGLHPETVQTLQQAMVLEKKAKKSFFSRTRLIEHALETLKASRIQLVDNS